MIARIIKMFVFIFIVLIASHKITFAQIDSFIVAGVHPKAAAQSTVSGRAIVALFAWKGKLYAGYGDYGANTGPISIMAFDPIVRTFTGELIANTEAVFNFRAIRGRVYAPAIDRKLYSEPGDYSILDTNGVWSNRDCGSTTHAYDVASLTATDIWIVGSQNEKAAVFRSTDDGATWKTVLRDTVITGNPNDFARFYFAGVLNEKLYVQARDYYGSLHPASKVFDGTTWSDGPDLFPTARSGLGCRPEIFSGKLVYRSWQPGRSSNLFTFDGVNARALDSMLVFDVVIDSDYCYVLADSGSGVITVKRTRDLTTWTQMARVPSNSRSLAVLNGKIYIGTSDSQILELVQSTPTSVREISDQPASPFLRVFPNPASEKVQIEINNVMGDFSITLLDFLGRKIFSTAGYEEGNIVIDLRGHPSGMYFVMMRDKNKITVKKLMLK